MFRFEEPLYLLILLLIPVLTALYVLMTWKARRSLRAFGDETVMKDLMPLRSPTRNHVKFALMMLAVALFAVLLARPQFGSRLETVKREGIEAIFALDISNSMLCQDVQPTRLDKAKRIITQLVERMENDKVGLIVFAGDAFTQLPITSDYISAKMFLESIDPSLINRQGTDVAKALSLAARSFTSMEEVGRTVVLITDGEDHEGGVEDAIKELSDKGITVNVLGVGSLEGAPIPLDGTQEYRKDKDGNVVITRLNEQMCQTIAQGGGGIYVRVDNSNAAQRAIQGEMDKMSKAEIETQVYTEYNEQFQSIAWMALIVLLLELFIMECRNLFFDRFHLFHKDS